MSDPVERVVVAMLKAKAEVAAIVGQRVYGETAPQAAALPYVTVAVDRETAEIHGSLANASALVRCWARDAATAGALADAVGGLHGFRGAVAGQAVRGVFDEGRTNADDPPTDGSELGRRGRGVSLRVFCITI